MSENPQKEDDDSPKFSSSKSGGSLMGAGLLALGLASGCDPGEGPCGVPEIKNRSNNLSTEFVTQRITDLIDFSEDVNADMACIPNLKIVVDPTSEEEMEEILAGNNDIAGTYYWVNNSLHLKEWAFERMDDTEFFSSGFHELVHGQQDIKGLGWPNWKESVKDVDWHRTGESEAPEGEVWDPRCVTYYACDRPLEHHADSFSYVSTQPLMLEVSESLREVKSSVEKELGALFVSAYSEVDAWSGFENAEGKDSPGSFFAFDEEGNLNKGSVGFYFDGENTILKIGLHEQGHDSLEHEFNIEGEWWFGGGAKYSDGKVAFPIHTFVDGEYLYKFCAFDFESGDFYEVDSEMESFGGQHFEGINPNLVFHEGALYVAPKDVYEAAPGELLNILRFDFDSQQWDSVETEVPSNLIKEGVHLSNVDSEGNVVLKHGPYAYFMDLKTGNVSSKTYVPAARVDKKTGLVLTDSGHFYELVQPYAEDSVFLMEGAEGDVRMRYVDVSDLIGSLTELAVVEGEEIILFNEVSLFSDGEAAYFAVHGSDEKTSFLKASLEE